MNSLDNWKTTLIGLLIAIIGVVQAAHAASIQAALQDPKVQIDILAAVGLVLAKDASKTGTSENPRATNQGDPTPQAKP